MSAQPCQGGGQSQHRQTAGTCDIFPGDIHLNTGVTSEGESLPSFTDHTPALSLVSQCVQHSNFRAGGRSGESKGWQGRDGSNLNELEGLVSRFGPMRTLWIVRKRNSGDILQQQKLYYCGVSREQELGE